MFTRISVFEVENILINNLNLDFKLINLKYYISNSEQIITIYCTNTEKIQEKLRIYNKIESVGIPIIKIEKNRASILPSIINFISNKYDSHHLELEYIISISFGKSVQLIKSDSYCFILNNLGDKISFGKIEDNVFIPLIDLGWYLRQGT